MPQFQMSEGNRASLRESAFRLELSPLDEIDDHKTCHGVKDLWPLLVRAFLPSRIRCFSHKFGLNTFAVCTPDIGGLSESEP